MAEKPKQARRIRKDAICNAIRKGEYDDVIPEIQAAIDARNDERKAAVEALVKEVYGEQFRVAGPAAPNPVPSGGDADVPQPQPVPQDGDPFPESDKEREMEVDIERRGASIEGVGPGGIA
jgi:hypothetical protein